TRAVTTAHIAAFIRHRPHLLHMLPTDDSGAGHAWPSPRTWDAAARILTVITDEATQTLALAGLVGLGAAHEFITWRSAMDLPDPADVTADPDSIDWATLSPDRAWAVLTGVVAYASSPGTTAAWRAGWKALAVASEHGHAAIAAACALDLMTSRPRNATPPASVKKFATALAAAGYTSAA
ncbi:MAG: AAA family ATPase, partial [Humibacillus sp.]|nr:AAA family ATPase [Humibacillus sp.]